MRRFFLILAGMCICGIYGLAQPLPDERVVVELRVHGVGRKEVNILVRNGEAYLPVITLFDFLGIKSAYDSSTIKVEGFFKTPDTSYVIDPTAGFAAIDERSIVMTDQDYAVIGNELFVRLGILNEMFRLDIRYRPRALVVEVGKFRDLPAYQTLARRRRLEQLQKRRNLIPSSELYLGRVPAVLGSERLDWTLSSRFTSSQYLQTRYTASLGAQVLGGDATGKLSGFDDPLSGLTENHVQGQIRFPFLDNSVIRQITIGDFSDFGIQPRLVTGVEITNRPLAQRYFFTREVFRGQFEPNVDVEMRGGLSGIQQQQTNDEGLYQFDLPIIYGQGNMEIHAYDPWGQEHVYRYRMNVPRTLLPPGEFEYSISGGRIRPPSNMLTSASSFSYGASSMFTVGGRLEYYDLATATDKFYGAITATSLLSRGLAFNAVVAPQAVSQVGVDWQFPNYAEVSVTGAKYARSAFFNPTLIDDDYNVTMTLPFSSDGTQVVLGIFGGQTDYPGFRDSQLQLSLSGGFSIFYPSYSSQLSWRSDNSTGVTTQLTHISIGSLAVYLPAGVVGLEELTYDHMLEKTTDERVEIFKRLPNSLQIVMMYERMPIFETYNVGLQLLYYFPFVRAQGNLTSAEMKHSTYNTLFSGSVSLDPRLLAVFFQNTPNYVGYGGMVVHPFLDENGNGKQDPGEESITTGRIYFADLTREAMPAGLPVNRFSAVRLPSYEEYGIYLDPRTLDNPIWVPEFSSIKMLAEPNYLRRIDIPVVNGGTIRGSVSLSDGTTKALEGITVKLTTLANGNHGKNLVRTTSTFSTGEFEFDLVAPGSYLVEVDPSQPQVRGYQIQPPNKQVEIVPKPDGDLVTGVDFVVKGK